MKKRSKGKGTKRRTVSKGLPKASCTLQGEPIGRSSTYKGFLCGKAPSLRSRHRDSQSAGYIQSDTSQHGLQQFTGKPHGGFSGRPFVVVAAVCCWAVGLLVGRQIFAVPINIFEMTTSQVRQSFDGKVPCYPQDQSVVETVSGHLKILFHN
jgi:hypothetical protein